MFYGSIKFTCDFGIHKSMIYPTALDVKSYLNPELAAQNDEGL